MDHLSKHARIEAENDFKNGTLKALVCTSSLELGIDVGDTDFVIQYNSPREVTRIVQRVGRSGHRVGQTSRGMILATNPEDLSESLVIARRALTGTLEQFSGSTKSSLGSFESNHLPCIGIRANQRKNRL